MTALLLSLFVALALFAVAALIITAVVGGKSPVESRLAAIQGRPGFADDTEYEALGAQDIFAMLTRPLAPFRDWLRSRDEQLGNRLSVAGFRKPEDIDTFLSTKLLGPVVGIILATFTGSDNFFLYAMICGVLGFFIPDIFLFYKAGKRNQKIWKALPDALDLMVICMEAGLGIDQSVLKIASEIQPVYPEMSEELLIISREQRAGKPRLEAWRSMADRVDVDAIRQFVAMLVQTDRLGTPIAQALGTFADGLRTQRMLKAEENAAKTSIKLLFPLIFFIFPALFVVLLGPALIRMMKTFEDMQR
ncbi:MAG: type II secretion system F family protein [Candidatus Korobacteraceae bacterium]